MKTRNLLLPGIFVLNVGLIYQALALPTMPSVPAPVAQPVTPGSSVTPVSMIQPAAPTTAVASTPAVTIPSQSSSVTPAASKAAYEKDFEDINKSLSEAMLIKKTMKDIVKDVNDKLLEARKKVLEAQKLSFNVLQKTQAEAESLIVQASSELQKLQGIQNAVQSDLVPKFNGNVKKVEELIKQIQDKVAELQTKGLKFQVAKSQEQSQPSTPVAATQQVGTVVNATSPSGASPVLPANETVKEPTFYGKAWDWSTEKVAATVNYARKSWKRFRNWAFKPDVTDLPVSEDSKKNFKYAADLEQVSKYKSPESEDKVAASLEVAKKYVTIFLSGANDIENQLNYTLQQYLALRIKIKALEKILMSNDEFRDYLDYCETIDPWWKRHIIQNFNDFLDSCVVVYAATKKIAIRAYNYFLADLVNKFLYDVNEKMKREEEQESARLARATEQKNEAEQTNEEEKKAESVPAMPMIK